MCPISLDQALEHVDPSLSTQVPEGGGDSPAIASAKRIQEGVRASEAYWDSRPPLERYEAIAAGHGVISRGEDVPPTPSVTATDTSSVVEGSATEEPLTGLGTGATGTQQDNGTPAPENTDPAEKLREQLRTAGLTPEA